MTITENTKKLPRRPIFDMVTPRGRIVGIAAILLGKVGLNIYSAWNPAGGNIEALLHPSLRTVAIVFSGWLPLLLAAPFGYWMWGIIGRRIAARNVDRISQ